MRPFSLALIVLLLFCFLAACTSQEKAPTPTRITRQTDLALNDPLIIGTALTQPFEYRETGTNRLIGFDVDLMTRIAEQWGVALEWREMAFADLLDELNRGNVDVVIAGMYITAAREEIVDFTNPYLDTGLVMVVRSDETAITDFASLANRTVGVKENATGERRAISLRDEEGIPLEIRRYTDTSDSLEDLEAGHIDVVFNDKLNTLEYIKTHPNLKIVGDVFDPAGVGIAVKTGSLQLLHSLNQALADLAAAGELERLYNRWINPETSS